MNGHKEVCIKRGSFCPVCKGTVGEDCWHEASEFQSGSFKYDNLEKEITALKAELAAKEGVNQIIEICRNALGSLSRMEERIMRANLTNHSDLTEGKK